MANITVTHTFSNGTPADATEVNTNFADIIAGTSDASKDFSINALTVAGTANFAAAVNLNGNTTIGNASTDTVTFTARVASDIDPTTTATYSFGSTTLTYKDLFLDNDVTDGGAIYFNASATAFIKSDASAGDLDISGFTNLDLNGLAITGAAGASFDGAVIINESGADVDFRVEGDTLTHLLFVDASTDRVGINTSTPGDILDINGGSSATTPTVRTTGAGLACGWRIESATDGTGNIYFGDAADGAQGRIIYNHSGDYMAFYTSSAGGAGAERVRLDSNGYLGIATTNPLHPVHIEGADLKGLQIGAAGGQDIFLYGDNSFGAVIAANVNLGFSGDSGTTKHLVLGTTGNLGIGTTPSYKIHTAWVANDQFRLLNSSDALANTEINGIIIQSLVKNSLTRGAELGITTNSSSTNGAAYLYLQPDDGGSSGNYYWSDDSDLLRTGTFAQVGTTGGTVVGDQTSDLRLKQNICSTTKGLQIALMLNPIEFEFINRPGIKRIGYGAQDVELWIPEAVYRTGCDREGVEDVYAMDYNPIIPVLNKAIQELHDKIIDLELKLAG